MDPQSHRGRDKIWSTCKVSNIYSPLHCSAVVGYRLQYESPANLSTTFPLFYYNQPAIWIETTCFKDTDINVGSSLGNPIYKMCDLGQTLIKT